MWTLKVRQDGSVFLSYDRTRRFNPRFRGLWEYIGPRDHEDIGRIIEVNEAAGVMCVEDDRGGVRMLVLKD